MEGDHDVEKKLEKDFFFFLTFVDKFRCSLSNQKDQELTDKWLEWFLSGNFTTVQEKRERNILLSRLVMNMEDGQLSALFHESPEQLKISRDPTFQNTALSKTYLNQVSKDNRTYLATKTLPNENGMMGFVAISTGGEHPTWKAPDPLFTRASEGNRRDLFSFYQDMIHRLEDGIRSPDDIDDPYLKNVLDVAGEGSDAQKILEKLKRSFQKKLEKAVLRDKILNRAERECNSTTENGLSEIDEWIVDTKPVDSVYPPELIEALLQVLSNERRRCFLMFERRHRQFLDSLQKELLKEIQEGMTRYGMARTLWWEAATVILH